MTERLFLTYGHPVQTKPFPYQVDVTGSSNALELDTLIRQRRWLAHKYMIIDFDYSANKPVHRFVIRLNDHMAAVELKLRIEY